MSGSNLTIRPSRILEEKREEVLALLQRRGAANPRVFGSVARGTDTPESDVDILVTVKPENAWEFVGLGRELSELLGVRVDVMSDGGLKEKHSHLIREARPL